MISVKNRMQRVDELIQRELGMVFERHVAPQVNCLLTITQVKTSPDLRQAQVFVSLLGGGVEARWPEVLAVLQEYRKEMQHEIARRIKLKYTPVLRFVLDQTLAEADRVLTLIDRLGISEEPSGPAPVKGPGPASGSEQTP